MTARVGRALTAAAGPAQAGPAITRALAAAGRAHPGLLAEITARSPGEPYRSYLLYAARRLRATRLGEAGLAYGGPAEFIADLRLAQGALARAGASRQAFGELQHLIWQAETFGFHLAGLEIRQHSAVHARALQQPGGAASGRHVLTRTVYKAKQHGIIQQCASELSEFKSLLAMAQL